MNKRLFVVVAAMAFFASMTSAAGSLSLSLNSLDPVSVGDSATLTATVTASGDSVSNAQVSITLPTGLSTSDATTQNIGTLSSGQSSSKSWSISGNSADTYTITVSATGTSVTTQSSSATLTVNTAAFFAVTQVTSPASSLTNGGTTNLQLKFSNTGGSSGTVTIIVTPSSGLTITSGTSQQSIDVNGGQDTTVTWTFRLDNNSDQTISVTITSTENNPDDLSYSISGPGTSSTTSSTTTSSTTSTTSTASSAAGGGGGGGSSSPKISRADVENPAQILSETKFAPVTSVTPEGLSFEREASYKLVKSSETGASVTVWAFNVGIKNDSGAPRQNVTVTETIPKEIASNVSLITFGDKPNRIVNPDPVVEWLVEELGPGEEKKFLYYVTSISDKKISGNIGSFVTTMAPAQVASEEKAAAQEAVPFCRGSRCDDSNPCTTDSCNEVSDKCFHSNAPEGTGCGGGNVCRLGQCVAPTLTGLPEEKDKVVLGGVLASGAVSAIGVGIIVLILAGYLLYTRSKKPKLFPKKKF